MPNIEQPLINVSENSDIEKSENESEDENKSWWGGKAKLFMVTSTILSTLGGPVLGAGSKSAEDHFTSDERGKTEVLESSGNAQEQNLDSLGTKVNVEAENEDLEIRSVSLHQLGFKSIDDFVVQFNRFRQIHENKYSNSEDIEQWANLYLDFINSKIMEIMGPGHESYVLTKTESEKINKEFRRLAEVAHLRMQLGIAELEYVGSKKMNTLVYNRTLRDKFGNTKVEGGGLIGHPGDLDSEIIIKVEEK